ncbi:MAG TPA: ATP-binding protein [Pyrinomonadaceae bacterium]|nr:ATP-binding protein [Pyrinomonadaceae bacterium]
MIKSIRFQNFKALRDATLPLGPFTLIVGPNGSGKSTAVQAFSFGSSYDYKRLDDWVTVGAEVSSEVAVHFNWQMDGNEFITSVGLKKEFSPVKLGTLPMRNNLSAIRPPFLGYEGFRVFSFEANAIAKPVMTSPNPQLEQDGSNLAAVLDGLRDSDPERLEEMNRELNRWLPEFDRILLATPEEGKKSFALRTSVGHFRLPASELSQGVLLALAFLAVVYAPNPPSIVCFEEPDRGIHPRLFVDIRDAMYRLAFPENYGEKRKSVQVIATTHSPYLLDLYKEHPEQIVIAHKDEQGVHFERLSEKPHIDEILESAPLGDIWYSGILGGVPSAP